MIVYGPDRADLFRRAGSYVDKNSQRLALTTACRVQGWTVAHAKVEGVVRDCAAASAGRGTIAFGGAAGEQGRSVVLAQGVVTLPTTKTFQAFRDDWKGDTDRLFRECKSDEDQFVAALRKASPETFGKMDDEELRRSLRERWMQDVVDAHKKK